MTSTSSRSTLPLKDITISTSGRFPGTTQGAIQTRITSLGGTFSTKITPETSILITTEKDYQSEGGSTKVNAAREKGDVSIVGLGWLEETEKTGIKADEKDHSFDGAIGTATASTSAAGAAITDTATTATTTPKTRQPLSTKATKDKGKRKENQAEISSDEGEKDGPLESPTKKLKGVDGIALPGPGDVTALKVKGKPKSKTTAAGIDITDISDGKAGPSTSKSDASKPAPKPIRSEAKVNVPVGRAQIANAQKKIHVPLDEHCPETDYHVYIDPAGLIWDASLNQTNASANNNKFYKIQLVQSPTGSRYLTWTRWGRVGERGQNAMLGGGSLMDAMSCFEKKFKDKSGLKWADRTGEPKANKYAYVEKSYQPDSDDEDDEMEESGSKQSNKGKERADDTPDSSLAKPVQNLMELIFNQKYQQDALLSMNYDTEKMPLGKLSKGTISRGFQALKDLAAVINTPGQAQVEPISNRYYSLIPHAFGRNRPPIINSHERLKKEIELLESLSDMKEASDMLKEANRESHSAHLNQLDRQYETLGMGEMEPLDGKSAEFTELVEYLTKTKGATHNLKYAVQDIFRIQRKGEFERFDSSPFVKDASSSNRRLLWHGSRVTNFAGILGQGLRIAPPEAPVSGYMFGKGIYLADMSSKSANYCAHHQSGGTALLLLCEAELGDPVLELTNASYTAGEDALAKGMTSTWGKGRVGPLKWKDANCVHPSLAGTLMPDVSVVPGDTKVDGAYLQYNEYIAYDIAQVRLRYLLRVRMQDTYQY